MGKRARSATDTPMMRQYLRVKADHPEAILFYRMGDFYEMFFEDAEVASRVLNIALTSRDKDREDPIPLCGVPWHSADGYIARLVREGHKVAVCEQLDEPGGTSKLVRREVVRVVTPGTILSDSFLNEQKNNFLAAVNPQGERTGLAFLDISTGEFVALETGPVTGMETLSRLADYEPAELIVPAGSEAGLDRLLSRSGFAGLRPHSLEATEFDPARARRQLLDQFETLTLEPFGLGEGDDATAGAAGAVLRYALDTQKRGLPHVRRLTVLRGDTHLVMDAATQRNLELARSALHGGKEGTLLGILDRTLTPMGARLMRQRLLRPLTDPGAIGERLDAVDELVERDDLLELIRRDLKPVLDLERLLGRVTMSLAGPRDLLSLKNSLESFPSLRDHLKDSGTRLLGEVWDRLDPIEDLREILAAAVSEDAPVTTRDGGFIREGWDESLDEWLTIRQKGRRLVAGLEARERERTGIQTLKVRYNKVFGYFIEVTRAHADSVPPDYQRKQTLVGAERFSFPELAELETKILEAQERSLAREIDLFDVLCREVLERASRIRGTCGAVAELDTLQGLATVAVANDYRRPVVDTGNTIDIRDGRHPVVEVLNREEPFIPNDCHLNTSDRQILIITGPNMAGKSTYLRQVALVVIMAQMGSFVPCAEARIGVVDRIFTRVGATDYLVRGQSTFMVEMTETATILNNATPRSLVVLDEVGRGTSTFDGLSIAWAVAEYLHENKSTKARCLFATHYHQLTELALTLPGVRNLSTAVREWGDRIIFLRKIEDGGTDKSYGIQVARLAGLPAAVITRAREILANLEEGELNGAGLPRLASQHAAEKGSPQLYLFHGAGEEVLDRLRELDPHRLTPIEALNLLAELRTLLKGS